MRDGLQAPRAPVRRVDARADHGHVYAVGAEGLCPLDRGRVRRLDDDGLDAAELCVVEHGLVAQPGDDEGEKLAHLGIGLADEHSGHSLTIVGPEPNVGCIWYGTRMKRSRILVVDDDRDIRGLLRELLARAGYDVAEAESGKAGLREFYASPPDLVLLDVSMPELDGWQTLERIRDLSEVPVMMLTARAGELEKVRGLKGGADDYVTKPFGRQELLARVEALLRRSGPRGEEPTTYGDGAVTIDFAQREVTVGGRKVVLTPLEFKLLACLAKHLEMVVTQKQLLAEVWGPTHVEDTHYLRVYMKQLRDKLEAEPERPRYFLTEPGVGYRLRVDE